MVSRQSQEQLYDYPSYHLTLQNMGGIGLSSAPQMPSLPDKTTVGDWSLSYSTTKLSQLKKNPQINALPTFPDWSSSGQGIAMYCSIVWNLVTQV